MKIIHLVAENVKRLVAVDITPEGHVIEITGENGSGKTSVLDAIFWAIAGERPIQSHPIHDGEEKARIRLDLGEFIVTRRFDAVAGGGFTTSVKVENADGARVAKPQTMLDSLIGALAFDPLAFARSKPADQFEELKRLTGLDFNALEAANKADFETRTGVSRLIREYQALLSSMPPVEAPGAPVDEEALVTALRDAGPHNTDIQARKQRRDTAEARIVAIDQEMTKLLQEKTDLRQRLDNAGPLAALIDTNAIVEKLSAAREGNRLIAKAKERADMVAKIASVEQQAQALTAGIEEREREKRRMIAGAEMPIEGLSFGDGIVTLGGQPFDQASDAEQLQASVAIAAAMNPKLRVIRVRDGSLLDDTSMSALADFAAQRDYQVWIEVVDSDRPGAIIIEAGKVAGVVGDDGGPQRVPPAERGRASSASANGAPEASQASAGSTQPTSAPPSSAGDPDELDF
jgi:ABC-type dipeptide/oligopeptide/nickel transport system ATPase component